MVRLSQASQRLFTASLSGASMGLNGYRYARDSRSRTLLLSFSRTRRPDMFKGLKHLISETSNTLRVRIHSSKILTGEANRHSTDSWFTGR